MIQVTRLDRQSMYLNPDHIISIEETPDTVITLYNGHHILVREKCRVILNRIIAFKSSLIKRSGAACGGRSYIQRQRKRELWRSQSDGFEQREARIPLHNQEI